MYSHTLSPHPPLILFSLSRLFLSPFSLFSLSPLSIKKPHSRSIVSYNTLYAVTTTTRYQLEHRLEDALNRLRHSKSGGFLSSLFSSPSNGGPTPQGGVGEARHKSFSFSSKGRRSSVSNESSANLLQALEMAQFKVVSLEEEARGHQEAQQIVLDTKESVLRNLAKQNSQLTIERDSFTKRVDDMNVTVDQLTNLLRSIQTRKISQRSNGSPRKQDGTCPLPYMLFLICHLVSYYIYLLSTSPPLTPYTLIPHTQPTSQ